MLTHNSLKNPAVEVANMADFAPAVLQLRRTELYQRRKEAIFTLRGAENVELRKLARSAPWSMKGVLPVMGRNEQTCGLAYPA